MCLSFFHFYKLKKNLPSGPKVQVPIPLDAEILFCSPCAFRERLKKKKILGSEKENSHFYRKELIFSCVLTVAPHGIYVLL